MNRYFLQYIIIGTIFAGIAGCDFSNTTEVTIALFGQGGNYSGEYTIDDDSNGSSFTGKESTSSDIYKFSDDIELEDKVLIDVYPNTNEDDTTETDMTDLTFRVTDEDGNIIYEDSYAISSTLMKTFIYNVGDTQIDI